MRQKVEQSTWHGMYKNGWKGLICESSFNHPAKFAKDLIFHMVEHAIEEGWVKEGDTVLDPFAGAALGSLPCLLHSLRWLGCEIEERFVTLGQENLAFWARRFGVDHQAGCLVQGDSRRLSEVLGQAAMVVSSPPFAIGDSAGPESLTRRRDASAYAMRHSQGWGDGGQISPGNLATLPIGDPQAIISSPPFGSVEPVNDTAFFAAHRQAMGYNPAAPGGTPGHYGATEGQLGSSVPSTFWEAAQEIISQCYALLPISGHALWVVKDYCKNGAIVPFTAQWASLCESCGLTVVHEHHALLTTDYGTQGGLFGEDTKHATKRVSFFRRLHEKKRPDLAIDYETVLCCVKAR